MNLGQVMLSQDTKTQMTRKKIDEFGFFKIKIFHVLNDNIKKAKIQTIEW